MFIIGPVKSWKTPIVDAQKWRLWPLVVYFILPETKDLGLEVIQDYFKPQRTIFYVDCLESSGNPNNRARLLSCGNPDPVSGKNSPTNAAMDSGCESQCSNDLEFNSSQKTSQKFDLISWSLLAISIGNSQRLPKASNPMLKICNWSKFIYSPIQVIW